ncbi:MAG: thioesterase family protein [Actinomycetes bacterium]
MPIEPGLHATLEREVGPDDTARALGSGDLDVLGTPRLLAWCEQATVAAVADAVDPASTTVGTRVDLAHQRPSLVDATLTVRADLVHVDGRLLRFDVVAEEAVDGGLVMVGHGQVTRIVVDRDRFLTRGQASSSR